MTVVELTKFVPVIVRANAAPPAAAVVGERLLAVGTGLLMVKGSGADSTPPLGSKTVTKKVPAVAISEAAI